MNPVHGGSDIMWLFPLSQSWNSNLKFFVLSFSVCSVFAKGTLIYTVS